MAPKKSLISRSGAVSMSRPPVAGIGRVPFGCDVVGAMLAVPAPGDVLVRGDASVQAAVQTQTDVPVPVDVFAQADMCVPYDVPPQSATCGRRDTPARGDYEVVAKCTKLASSLGSARPVKKPHRSLTSELAKELSSS